MASVILHMKAQQVTSIKLPAAGVSDQTAALKLVQELIPTIAHFNKAAQREREQQENSGSPTRDCDEEEILMNQLIERLGI